MLNICKIFSLILILVYHYKDFDILKRTFLNEALSLLLIILTICLILLASSIIIPNNFDSFLIFPKEISASWMHKQLCQGFEHLTPTPFLKTITIIPYAPLKRTVLKIKFGTENELTATTYLFSDFIKLWGCENSLKFLNIPDYFLNSLI